MSDRYERDVVIECRRCGDCAGQKHRWIENDEFSDERDPEYACKHCSAFCRSRDDEDGLMTPTGIVLYVIKTALAPAEIYALHYAKNEVAAFTSRGGIVAKGRAAHRVLDKLIGAYPRGPKETP